MTSAPIHPQQSEYRRDPFRGEWVVMAPGRALRPQPPASVPPLDATQPGPFAAGNEALTPPELFAIRPHGGRANDASWRVRVVPNLYPAVRVEHQGGSRAEGPSDRMDGFGAHEVIIEDPDRTADLSSMEPERVFEVLASWRARLGDLRRDVRFACALLFQHRGIEAGATLMHPHSQLLALPFIPPPVAAEVASFVRYRAAHGRCALCDVIRHERASTQRLVVDGNVACAFAPFASRVPYELVVAPVGHLPAIEDSDDHVLRQVAATLRDGLRRIDARLARPAYRMWLRTAPWRGSDEERYGHHWHIAILPVTQRSGALEESSGMRINTVLPEEAAATLRSG